LVINREIRALCPLSATLQGLDGRTTRGHVDDYWTGFMSSAPDPFLGNWPEHAYGECTADYMGTNQSSFLNIDGMTTFYFYPDGSRIYDFTGAEPQRRDGCHGMRDFVESRGYTVDTNFSQYISGYNGNIKGFTFNDFKKEIDEGRPVLIHVEGHSMLGYGYDDADRTIYIHDTWDYLRHSMNWGEKYLDMPHYAVTVIRLAEEPENCLTIADDWSISIPCAVFDGISYAFTLDFYPYADDPAGIYFKMDLATVSNGLGEDCLLFGEDMSLPLPCVELDGTKYQFVLDFYPNPSDPAGLYWKMDLNSVVVK